MNWGESSGVVGVWGVGCGVWGSGGVGCGEVGRINKIISYLLTPEY
ncbi:MAG: hypothetical protein O9350_14670 [Microcystis sp. LE19-388.1G]|nr:hypothetical protein [Microcystis sp. LE19-388.1G]